MVPRPEAVPHLQRAIELDPNFAMAMALLSGVYPTTAVRPRAPAFSRGRSKLRDRVSERERFFISWRYYLDAEQAWDKALELSLSWTGTIRAKRLRSTASGWGPLRSGSTTGNAHSARPPP